MSLESKLLAENQKDRQIKKKTTKRRDIKKRAAMYAYEKDRKRRKNIIIIYMSSWIELWKIENPENNFFGKFVYKLYLSSECESGSIRDVVTVWTDTPELIYGTEFIAIQPDHILNSQYPHTRYLWMSKNSCPLCYSEYTLKLTRLLCHSIGYLWGVRIITCTLYKYL